MYCECPRIRLLMAVILPSKEFTSIIGFLPLLID